MLLYFFLSLPVPHCRKWLDYHRPIVTRVGTRLPCWNLHTLPIRADVKAWGPLLHCQGSQQCIRPEATSRAWPRFHKQLGNDQEKDESQDELFVFGIGANACNKEWTEKKACKEISHLHTVSNTRSFGASWERDSQKQNKPKQTYRDTDCQIADFATQWTQLDVCLRSIEMWWEAHFAKVAQKGQLTAKMLGGLLLLQQAYMERGLAKVPAHAECNQKPITSFWCSRCKTTHYTVIIF